MQQNDQLKGKLIAYLQDAESMERQIAETLEKQVDDTGKWPDVQRGIQNHLDATREHRQRMQACLKSYGESPSGVKSTLAGMMGNIVGMTAGTRTDALAKEARDDYMIEHVEIAAYELLIATAAAYGDRATVRACEANLRDEVAMAHWLEHQLPRTAFISFQQDGIQIPQAVASSAEQEALDCLHRASTAVDHTSQREASALASPTA